MARSLCLLACVAALGKFLSLADGSVVPSVAAAAAATAVASPVGPEGVSSGGSDLRQSRRRQGQRAACDHVVVPPANNNNDGEGHGRDTAGGSPRPRPLLWLMGSRRYGSGRDGTAEPPRGAAAARRRCVVGLRGGSTSIAEEGEEEPEVGKGVVRSMKVLVSTTKISSFVDARGEVTAQSDWTVGRLKEELEEKFPGKIPASLQRLFKGTHLLPSGMTLEEASEGAEGPLSLLLDNAPPIDASTFDPDTAVPSRRDGQVEAFSACLAAQSTLQEALLAVMRGDSGQEDPELSRSVKMKADFENTQALLQRTLDEVKDTGDDEQKTFGLFHEALRPLAHRFDVNWMQTAQRALFVYICAQFGATGAFRRAATLMLIPMIIVIQTRTARVAMKLVRNLAAEVPVVTQLFLGLLQAPEQVIMSTDTAAYTRDLYGPGGPKYDAAFLEESDDVEEEEGAEGSGLAQEADSD